MRLEIKSIHSPDVNLYAWSPETWDEVYVLVELEIGEREDERCDLFQVVVATPEALRRRWAGERFVLAERGVLVVADYDLRVLRRELERIVQDCAASSWPDAVALLQRYFLWEYE